MKTLTKILLGTGLVAGALSLSSCNSSGYVEADTGVYYGGPVYHDPWFHHGPWVYGNRGYGAPRSGGHADVYIHPPRPPRPPRLPRLPGT